MNTFRLSLAVLAALTAPRFAAAQRIVADISIRQGPIAGHIVLGDPLRRHSYREYVVEPWYHDYRPYHTVTVYSAHHGRGWYRHHGYHDTRLWYDVERDAWYDRWDDRYPGTLREVAVLEYDGRYYVDDGRDRRDWRDGRDGREGRDGRFTRRDDRREYDRDDHDDRDRE